MGTSAQLSKAEVLSMIRSGGMLVTRASCTRVWPTVIACRQVSSLGPLAAAFNTKQNVQFKFQWNQTKTGLFGLPELKDSQGFHELKERCGTKADLDNASTDELKKICQTYFDKWYSLEGEMFF